MSENEFEFDEQTINELNKNCAKVDEHRYIKFLNENVDGENSSFIYFLRVLIKNLSFNPTHKYTQLNLTKDEQIKLVVDFYASLNKKTGKLVKQILTGEHQDYDVEIKEDNKEEHSQGFVASSQLKKIWVFVILNGTLDGPITLAHECSHAISARSTQMYKLNGTKQQKELRSFLNRFTVDCIGETESKIVELLFADFLLDKGIMAKGDYINFINAHNNSLINDIFQILQENDVISNIDCPITVEAFKKFKQRIKNDKNYRAIMDRCKIMAQKTEDPSFAEYKFRYIVGEVVASVWHEKYIISSPKKQKEMIKNFLNYVTTQTDHIGIEEMIKTLLNCSVKDLGEEFYELTKSKNITV